MKLRSMDVTIRGVTKTYEFDPPESVDSDDEGEASLQLVGEAETTEVDLVGSMTSARVTVAYRYLKEGSVDVDLDDLDVFDSVSDVRQSVENGNFDAVYDAIEQDITTNFDATEADIDLEDIEAYDEDGEVVEDD